MKKSLRKFFILALLIIGIYSFFKQAHSIQNYEIGQVVDSFNGVKVYYNGSVGNVEGRNLSKDGYNLGLKYQCVEFVKRYYFEHYHHKMPDSYGHAKDFFDPKLSHGSLNKRRDLLQFKNTLNEKPKVGDLIIFGKTTFNIYGHVAIISKITEDYIEIIQQNPGPLGSSRERYPLKQEGSNFIIDQKNILGWLRKKGL